VHQYITDYILCADCESDINVSNCSLELSAIGADSSAPNLVLHCSLLFSPKTDNSLVLQIHNELFDYLNELSFMALIHNLREE